IACFSHSFLATQAWARQTWVSAPHLDSTECPLRPWRRHSCLPRRDSYRRLRREKCGLALLAAACAALALTGCSAGSQREVRTYAMGDRIVLGQLVYTIYETR